MGEAARRRTVSFVALNYAPSIGGAQEYVRQLAEGLVARGHDVEVLTTDAVRSPGGRDPGKIALRTEVIGGVTVRRFSQPALLRSLQRLARPALGFAPWTPKDPAERQLGPLLAGPHSPGLMAAIRQATRTRDVVVACSAPFTTFVVAPRCSRKRRVARVLGMPLLHVARVMPPASIGRALRGCDVVLASTESEAEVQRALGVEAGRIRVVPPGTDLTPGAPLTAAEARRRLGLPERPTVGYVGRLAAYKGIDTLLAAAPSIWDRAPNTTVLVAGLPAGFSGHRDAQRSGLGADRLVVREGFADDERALLLAACDVVALPSRDESFGLVIVEAWAAGRPVVAADIAAVRCTVQPGINGELVPPGDHRGLADALVSLLADPDRARSMGEAGQRAVEERYRWASIVDRWHEIIASSARVA